ncbi:pyrroline-5-carboxylate reductase dimerization domain-containing protein [Rhizobium rhizogenes]
MDTVTAVSGSGPATYFTSSRRCVRQAYRQGWMRSLPLAAKQTVFGSAKLAIEATEPPATLRNK